MLRFVDFNSKLISDFEKYQFVKNMARGVISKICKGSAKSINKLLKSYDASELTYLANIL